MTLPQTIPQRPDAPRLRNGNIVETAQAAKRPLVASDEFDRVGCHPQAHPGVPVEGRFDHRRDRGHREIGVRIAERYHDSYFLGC
jgi:hypothetical protein